MPYKDPQSPAAKASNKRRSDKWKANNREKYLEAQIKYNLEHKEEKAHYHKTNENHYKLRTISNWKRIGVIDGDYDLLFEVYNKETNCWICLEPFNKRNNKHLDHDHNITDENNVRYICCRSCNVSLLNDKN
jgi:hypothetical protein